jgi:hypothetical protein
MAKTVNGKPVSGRVLQAIDNTDTLANAMLEQARKAAASLNTPKPQGVAKSNSVTHSAEGHISAYKGKNGKNAGKTIYQWQHDHVTGNPMWARRFDATDIELILGNPEAARAAAKALRDLNK